MTDFIDAGAGLLLRIGMRRSRVFPGGWGDPLTIETLSDPATILRRPDPISIIWGRKEERRGHRVIRGRFASPNAKMLPEQARAVTIEKIEPAKGSSPLIVLLPAWNDHGFARRRVLAGELLRHNIGSLIFDIAFYGTRRTTNTQDQAIQTVADFALMGVTAIKDAHAIAATVDGPHGFAGFSMGGNLAALASATYGEPVATAALAASHSPGPVFLDGVLSNAVSWDALGGRQSAPQLRETLSSASVLNYDPHPHHAHAVLVAAENDGFVPFSAAAQLADHWGAELRTISGGHANALWRHSATLADAVHASCVRLDEARP